MDEKQNFPPDYIRDLTGQRFGKLVVVGYLYCKKYKNKDRIKNRYYWNCSCDCSGSCIVEGRSLIHSVTKSCGCLPKGIPQKLDSTLTELYNRYKCQSQSANHPFEISKERFAELTQQDCYYCGRPPFQVVKPNHKYPYVYNGLDRISSDGGYTEGNIVVSCGICNRMKLDHNLDFFLSHIQKIIENMKNK